MQIKQISELIDGNLDNSEDYEDSIIAIINDLKIRKNIVFDARFLSLLIILSQVNLNIWDAKEEMMKGNFDENLALSHKLNGVRNTIKNQLASYANETTEKTNTNTDGLIYGAV